MPLERSDIEAALEKKGFARSKGDHRFFTYYTIAGIKTSVWTKTSHGTKYKTIDDGLVGKMAKQCGLTSPQFKQLIDCPLGRKEYESIVIDSGRIIIKKAATKPTMKGS
jgi:predicted RNA binding protein YcfA (HicA-like mRNA interferase family)